MGIIIDLARENKMAIALVMTEKKFKIYTYIRAIKALTEERSYEDIPENAAEAANEVRFLQRDMYVKRFIVIDNSVIPVVITGDTDFGKN